MKKGILALCLFCSSLWASASKIHIDNPNNLANEGYDGVSYFQGVPQLGLSLYEMEWRGVKWRFSSQENMERFSSDPSAYAAQFGGYCPWSLAHNRLRGGLPHLWRVVDGKLYFFCSSQAMQEWSEEMGKINGLANERWPGILNQV